MVKLQNLELVDDSGYSGKINSQTCHLGSFNLSHSKRLMNDVIQATDGFKKEIKFTRVIPILYIFKKMITIF